MFCVGKCKVVDEFLASPRFCRVQTVCTHSQRNRAGGGKFKYRSRPDFMEPGSFFDFTLHFNPEYLVNKEGGF
jgi:hypothetical protein